MTAVVNAFPSASLRWLADGGRAEYTSGLGQSYALHVRGTKKTAGALVHRVQRIVDSKHVLFVIERDLNTPGDYPGKGLRPKRGPDGRVIRHAESWAQPFHEGVKRLVPRGDGHGYAGLRAHWLRTYLRWLGVVCPCNHADVVEHLADESDVPPQEIRAGIERAAREAARTIGSRAGPDNPLAIPVRTATQVHREARR